MGGRVLIAHSGGPTAVLNASLVGIVEEARRSGIDRVYGARFGVEGILAEELVDLSGLSDQMLTAIAEAPSSALGTSRRALVDVEIERIIDVCRTHAIDCLLFTGGNGSMGTAHRIASIAERGGHGLRVIGVPKTIDNDLVGTDHAPGYPSAARYAAGAVRDIGSDNRALPGLVQVLEVLGRNTGWIAAATALARRTPDDDGDAPHLIYAPERPLPLETLLSDVQRVFDRLRHCTVVVCEGQLDDTGQPFGADVRVSSRGPLATNLAHRLALLITERLGIKARGEKPGLLGRVSQAFRSPVDWDEARCVGHAAIRAAVGGASGVMVTLARIPDTQYRATTGLVPLEQVADVQRFLPLDWIDASGRVSRAFLEYVTPLVGPIDRYRTLDL